ncbi:MAG: GNAT family N-acetyltransferase [Oscillospiraceae bacterium]|nr:GNAT family N-acetyltransferase [Oscillospiraceae bacterium]
MDEKKYTLRYGTEKDYEDILDFGNYVFHTDFRFLPKLYVGNPARAGEHVLVTEPRENGERIRAMVGSFKIPMSVAGQKLLIRGIGTVSVHPYDRGKGYMKLAMHKAIEDAKAEGADFMILSGRKQRYQHYGFDQCAAFYNFELTPSVFEQLTRFGVEGITAPVSLDGYRLLSEEESAAYEADCRALFESQPVYGIRKNFTETAKSWRSELRVLLKDGAFAGYTAAGNPYGVMTAGELLLNKNAETIPALLAVYQGLTGGKQQLAVNVQPFQTDLIHALGLIAEYGKLETGHGIHVLNYARVAQAYLQVKASYEPLMDGSYVFRVPGTASVRLSVESGKVHAENVSEDVPADITLTHLRMMNFLFEPFGHAGIHGAQPELEKNWFPIPVCFSQQDNV